MLLWARGAAVRNACELACEAVERAIFLGPGPRFLVEHALSRSLLCNGAWADDEAVLYFLALLKAA